MAARFLPRTVSRWREHSGVRMRSTTPKVLHRLGGTPLLLRVLDVVRQLGIEQVVAVLDAAEGPVSDALPADVDVAVQSFAGGTADATRVGLDALNPLPDT